VTTEQAEGGIRRPATACRVHDEEKPIKGGLLSDKKNWIPNIKLNVSGIKCEEHD
jgi:hypothetical protein